MTTKNLSQTLGIIFIGTTSYFFSSPAFSQQTNCSNYRLNPHTRQKECLSVMSNRNVGLISEKSKLYAPYEALFEAARTSLNVSCFSVWSKKADEFSYGSSSYYKFEKAYEKCKLAEHELRKQKREQEIARKQQKIKTDFADARTSLDISCYSIWSKKRNELDSKGFSIDVIEKQSLDIIILERAFQECKVSQQKLEEQE